MALSRCTPGVVARDPDSSDDRSAPLNSGSSTRFILYMGVNCDSVNAPRTVDTRMIATIGNHCRLAMSARSLMSPSAAAGSGAIKSAGLSASTLSPGLAVPDPTRLPVA